GSRSQLPVSSCQFSCCDGNWKLETGNWKLITTAKPKDTPVMTNRHFVIAALALACAVASAIAQQNPYLGRWNILGTGENSNYVYWLEVKEDGGKLSGMLLNRGGHPLPLPVIKIENEEHTSELQSQS